MNDDRPNLERPICAVGAIIFYDDRVLLVKRVNPPAQGKWSLPGGKQKLGETLQTAISREIEEETGLIFSPSGIVDTIDIIHTDDGGTIDYHYSIVDYWGVVDTSDAKAGSDVSEIAWASRSELAHFELNEATLAMIAKANECYTRRQKHSVGGHLKMVGVAALFGLSAYGVLYIFMTIFRALGIQDF